MTHQVVQNILMFQRISKYKPEQLYKVLADESPLTVAIVMSKLTPELAKSILKYFPSDEQKEIMYKVAESNNVSSEAINAVANALGSKLRVFDEGANLQGVGGHDKMAEILKHMGPSKSAELLRNIENRDSGMAYNLKNKMIKFSDIPTLETEGLMKAFMKIDNETLALSLKGESDEIVIAVAKAMSVNRRKLLISELKSMGPKKRTEVDLAQNEVLIVLRDLYESGILRLSADASDEEWV